MARSRQRYDARNQLQQLGMTFDEADRLLRAANKLRLWHELECGVDAGGIERDEETGALTWYSSLTGKRSPWHGQDSEKIAKRWIVDVMQHHPTLSYYVQGDPRGCALYILRPGDIPPGGAVDAYYSRGIAVYRD